MCKLGQREDSQSVLQCLPRTSWPQDHVFPALCFRLDEEETIATFSIGYADGYSRQLSGKGVVTTMDGETTGFSLSGHSFSLIQWLLSLEFNVGPIIKEMVEQAVKKSAKAPSPDNIPPECLKARVVVTANSMCIVARLFVYVCVCVCVGGGCGGGGGGGGLLHSSLYCQLHVFKAPKVYCVVLPTPCFQVAPSSQCYVVNSVLSSRPKFTVLCCQLHAFKLPQVHSVMLPTPCFQVAPSSRCYVANSVLSSRPKFTVLCFQLRAFKSPQVHSVMFPTPCFQVTEVHSVRLLTPCFQVAPSSQCYVVNSVLSSRPIFTELCCQLRAFKSSHVHSVPCFQVAPSSQLCCQLHAFKSPQVHNIMLPNPYFQVATSSKCYVANSVLSSRPKFTVSCCQLQVKNGRWWVECRWTPSPSRSGRAQPSTRLSTSTRTTWPRPTAWRAWREPWTPTLPMWQPR